MLTGDIRNQIDRIWDQFWSGGISNPLEVIEQITYLIFMRRLDEIQGLEERKAARTGKPIERVIFPKGKDGKGTPYQHLRWSKFKHFEAREMYEAVSDHVFPFLRTLGGDESTYAHHMKDARFTIPKASLLQTVVDLLDKVPMEDRDTKGDLYEYMLGKIASAGQNGQFRTPRHIIRLMVEMTAPKPTDVVCDPAAGTCGFLVAVGESLRLRHKELFADPKLNKHFHSGLFHGFDFDSTMLRIGSMNMMLHGVDSPEVVYRDSLSQDHAGEEEKYTLVLANPPFAGSLDYESCSKDLQQVVKTKKTELLFLALFLRLLKPGGRAAVIVPDGVLFGSSNAHKALREMLVEKQAGCGDLAAFGSIQALCGRLHGHPALHQDELRRHGPCLVLRRARRWLVPRRQAKSAARRRTARLCAGEKAERGRARQKQSAGCTRPLAAARQGGAQAPAYGAELLRAKGRHSRQRLRPEPEPLQGSRPRGSRARCAQEANSRVDEDRARD
jgi:type I restriction enzyme M protein